MTGSIPDGKMLLGGEWVGSSHRREVTNPYSGDTVGEVAEAGEAEVEAALAAAAAAAAQQRKVTAYDRQATLLKAAELADAAAGSLGRLIALETGKTIAEALGEAERAGDLLRLAAFEGTQLYGSSLPLDAHRGAGLSKLAFTVRQPCGVVVAITPFNYPVLLVLHKLAPAIAAGNAVILKPAGATPLTALALASILLEAGLPDGMLSVLPGSGAKLGPLLCADQRVRKISFTGSTDVGTQITRCAGVKRLSLELGASCPVVVLRDADVEFAAKTVAVGGYVNAGQVCISAQRVIVDRRRESEFVDALLPAVAAIRTGDPLSRDTTMGTMINEGEAARVTEAIKHAVEGGAQLLCGGERDGATVQAAVLTNVDPASGFSRSELFGPAVAVSTAESAEEAIRLANDSPYGLGAGLFTTDISRAVAFARDVDAGNIHINWSPLWRADLMPYGGLKGSGLGKEGPRAAVAEMTEEKTVVLHG
ncbi:MAG TPA: aldehyde dehydrogenase family protein [Acidobacteriaceae bacterium]|nr:aldehyde dehydrogenase family protein [Acidobacteriaceae bacterium]